MHNVSVVALGKGAFYFDYVCYTPSPTVWPTSAVIQVPSDDPDLHFIEFERVNRYNDLEPQTSVGGNRLVLQFYGSCYSIRPS